MTLFEALDLVTERTGHQRYRELCSEDNPDIEQRDAYRRLVLELGGEPEPDVVRAARLIAENPPVSRVGTGCGGCGSSTKG